MSFGALIRNEANTILIDADFINLNIIQRGVASVDVPVIIPERAGFPHIFFKIPPYMNSPDKAAYGLASMAANAPATRFGYTRYPWGDGPPATLEYAVADIGPPISPPGDTWGMKVWTGTGALAFGNMYKQPRIVQISTFGGGGITVPDASQDYWVACPTGAVAVDSWADSGTQIMDVTTMGVYWHNATTLYADAAVTLHYELGWGATAARHEDCANTHATILVAKI